jgi:hypothetical protein
MPKQSKKEDLVNKKNYKQKFKKQIYKPLKISYPKNFRRVPRKVQLRLKNRIVKRYNKRKKVRRNSKFLKKALRRFHSGRMLKRRNFSKKKLKNYLRLNIRVSPNNVFCNLKDGRSNNIVKSLSTGAVKLKTTKKRLNFNIKNFLFTFFKDIIKIKELKAKKHVLIKLVSPKKFRKRILKMFHAGVFKNFVKNKNLILDIPSNKLFNGCRPKKDIRKKRKFSLYEK